MNNQKEVYKYIDIKLLLEDLSYEILGDLKNIHFSNASDLNLQNDQSIIWIKNNVEISPIANLIICKKNIDINIDYNTQIVIKVDNPKFLFSKIVNALFVKNTFNGISSKSEIHENAKIGKNISIGPFCYIGNAIIGNNVIISANVTIYDNVIIGDNVIINSGTVIGTTGFGYSKNENNEIEKFPHIGGVIIEDNVEIGSNVSIDRGALGNTIIGKECKIDNLIHIAHNAKIGEKSYIIANSMIGGSVNIGTNSWIAPSVSILQQLTIGKDSTIGVGSIVTKNIPDNEVWTGSPARPINDFKKMLNAISKLINENNK